jgi:hypothetical protein
MQRAVFLVVAAVFLLSDTGLRAEPPGKSERTRSSSSAKKTTDRSPTRAQLLESANGWMYVNGEWVHPDGYKFLNNQIIRTTAKTGKSVPRPPGKLALENPTKLKSATAPAKDDAKTAAEKAAETRRKNLEPRPASQTGTHL